LKLIKLIGEGGMGKVYSARWVETLVAVKLLKTSTPDKSALYEVNVLSKLRHPCICTIFGTAVIDGHHALVLEYLVGGSLYELLRCKRSAGSMLLSIELCRMASQISAGLAYLHRNGVMHRDVKSANVLLDISLKQAKLADFGIAKTFDQPKHDHEDISSGRSQHTSCVGTYRYSAPEVHVSATYDERCDVYSFSLLLWEMIYNEVAFSGLDGASAAIYAASGVRPVISSTNPLVARLPGLKDIVTKCWSHEPSERILMPHCAEQLLDMLVKQTPSSTSSTTPTGDASSSTSWQLTPAETSFGVNENTAKIAASAEAAPPIQAAAASMSRP